MTSKHDSEVGRKVRDVYISCRCKPAEKAAFKNLAKHLNANISDLMVRSLRLATTGGVQLNSRTNKQLLSTNYQLRQIGINLNQIAFKLNAKQEVDIQELLISLRTIEQQNVKVRELLSGIRNESRNKAIEFRNDLRGS